MKIAFVMTHIPNPRMNKRIALAKSKGEVIVICVRRKSQDIWDIAIDDITYYVFDIDLPPSKNIIKRQILSIRFKANALKQISMYLPDVIYAEGFDSLLIAHKFKNKYHNTKLIYEVADLRERFIEQPRFVIDYIVFTILKGIEKRVFRSINMLVLTSMKFYDFHYSKLIHRDQVLYVPNIPDISIFDGYKKKNGKTFTIGFIGSIRYLTQMKMLVDAAEIVGCNVLFAGAGGTNTDFNIISQYCKTKEFVKFTGKYDYAKDIAHLYSMVDCVYAVYDADNPNVRIALPNKLYEAIYCELPIIVAKETYLSELVIEWGVGVAVQHNNLNELIIELEKLVYNKEHYSRIVKQCIFHKNDIVNSGYNEKMRNVFTLVSSHKNIK